MIRRILLMGIIVFSIVVLMFTIQRNSLINEEFSNKYFSNTGNYLSNKKSNDNSKYSEDFWTNNIFKL